MSRRVRRSLPAVVVATLLALAVFAPAFRARAGVAGAAFVPACPVVVQEDSGDSPSIVVPGAGIVQPLAAPGNFTSCDITIDTPAVTTGRLDVVLWDPVLLAPNPVTVALRSQTFDASQLAVNHLQASFTPPVVLRTIPGTADVFSGPFAIQYYDESGEHQILRYDPDGPMDLPTGRTMPGGEDLPGGHAVLSHRLCGGDAGVQEVRVVQGVMTCAGQGIGPVEYEIAQRVRLPVATDLRWIELAFAPFNGNGSRDPGLVALVEAAAGAPPAALPAAVAQSYFQNAVTRDQWGSHFDLDTTPRLEAGRDYWLVVRTSFDYLLRTKSIVGNESAAFQSAIGPLYSRSTPTGPWALVANRALNFRILGVPIDALGVPPTARAALSLRAGPNPARGRCGVAWTNAEGGVRLDVLDARGRRVAGTVSEASSGSWTWTGVDRDGRGVSSGLFYVRATDRAGATATRRVVMVR